MSGTSRLRDRARSLRIEAHALWLASRHPRVPWYAELGAVVGLLEDLLVLPLGVFVVVRLIPQDVLAQCRRAASDAAEAPKALGRLGAAAIVAVWAASFTAVGWIVLKAL